MEDDSIRGEITPQVTKEDINQTKKVRKRKNKGKTDTSIEHPNIEHPNIEHPNIDHPNIDHPNVLETSQLESETHERVQQLQPVQPVQPVQQAPVTPAASLTDLIQVPDGQGGYRTVRLIKRPVVQPTVWFPISSAPPWWSVQASINVLYWLMIVAAFVLRFWRIDLPKYVVFDEVHFGKFASYYLSNSFFFDVHPPLGKLVFAFIGYCNNFNGSFLFTTIGEEFPSEVPYVLMRGASALCGSLLIPSIYEIMIQLGFTHRGALLACFFTLFDNSLQTQSRVIMLDSFVVLFTYMSIMGYLKVYHYRSQPYTYQWHGWMIATGIFLGLLLGVKYTGLFALGCVGLLALCDIWQIVGDLAVDKMELFVHMAYRGIYLLGIPLLMNIALFYLHFLILTNSGPGNAFVSLPFQNTLEGDTVPPPVKYTVPDNSTLLRYSSQISFRSQDFSCWLHSHKDLYPLKYPDGRGSSYQQQVTCYEFQDKNNFWAIRRPGDPSDATITNDTDPVRNKDIIELVHVSTNKLLNSHDVAAPLSPANQEIAGYINYSTKFVPYLHWRIELQGVSENIPIFWAPKKTKFRLIHINSGQAVGCTGKRLPEWGFQQYEVATDRAVESSHTSWIMDDVNNPTSTDDMIEEEEMLRNSTMNQYKPVIQSQPPQDSNVSYSFWEKYFEMQGRMLAAHGNLGDHQFGAPPTQWPLLGKTLPYWLDNNTNAQMTLIGNPILWWMASASIALFFGILLVYLLRKRRNINDIPEDVYQQYWTSGLVLIVGWAAHYLPYFLLSRVLFLHHYLPALPFKFMLLAAMCEHGFLWSSKIKWRPLLMIRLYKGLIFVICLAVFSCFLLFAPFTFGYPSLTKSQIMWLRWRSHWDLLMRN